MTQVCEDVTVQKLVPGTGVNALRDNESWDATAISVDTLGASFRYSFDPLPDNAYFSGIFDRAVHATPTPGSYVAAFEVQDRSYRLWRGGLPVSPYRTWQVNDRFHIQYEGGLIRFYINSEEVSP